MFFVSKIAKMFAAWKLFCEEMYSVWQIDWVIDVIFGIYCADWSQVWPSNDNETNILQYPDLQRNEEETVE